MSILTASLWAVIGALSFFNAYLICAVVRAWRELKKALASHG